MLPGSHRVDALSSSASLRKSQHMTHIAALVLADAIVALDVLL